MVVAATQIMEQQQSVIINISSIRYQVSDGLTYGPTNGTNYSLPSHHYHHRHTTANRPHHQHHNHHGSQAITTPSKTNKFNKKKRTLQTSHKPTPALRLPAATVVSLPAFCVGCPIACLLQKPRQAATGIKIQKITFACCMLLTAYWDTYVQQ